MPNCAGLQFTTHSLHGEPAADARWPVPTRPAPDSTLLPAELCGTDLTRMEAVYEDGSPADDDIPGNIFAVGGIDVPDIGAEQHTVARREAARRFETMRDR